MIAVFFLMDSTWYVFLEAGVFTIFFNLVTTSWFLKSAYYFRFESINQLINLLPPTSGDANARGGGLSSSYIVY